MMRKIKYIIPCILLLLVQVFYSMPANAVGLTVQTGTPYATAIQPSASWGTHEGCLIWNSTIYPQNGNSCNFKAFKSDIGGWGLTNGHFIQVSFSINNQTNNDSLDALLYNFIRAQATNSSGTAIANLYPISIEGSRVTNSSSLLTYTFRIEGSGNARYIYFSWTDRVVLWQWEEFSVNFIQAVDPVSNSSTAITNSINQKSDEIMRVMYEQGSAQSAELQKQTEEIKKQTDEQKKQTDQQREQYEQDKQEEADRENQMQGAADDAAGLFNFSIRNPLEPIFGAFTAGNCVSIPNLARMVGSTETTYCSWFSSSTRSILTPVISIFSIIILFGFVVKWLNKDDGGGE